MKKQKKIIKYIFDEVYRHQLLFIAGCSLGEAKKELKKYKIDFTDPEVEANGIMCSFDKKDYPKMSSGIALFMWIRSRKDFYTLLHETTHLVVKVFELSNIDINSFTTENFAFYHEFWFKKLWHEMSKKS